MFELTEEELLIINQNEIVSSNGLIEKEKGFTQLLNTYLKDTFNEEHLETENVPGDGSCLYHAILLSFERKYGKKLEIDHKEMRRKVALHMLKFKENITYLNNYSQHENDIINFSNSRKQNIRKRYVKYAEAHLNNTNHWPSELCIHIIARIYNLEIVVLQEQVIPGIGPLGYIIERLRTTGLENATNATNTATATPATTATVSSFRHMPSYIIHDNRRRNAPEDQKHIPELIWEDSFDNESDNVREDMVEIFTNSAIPATTAASTATSAAASAATATTTATVAATANATATATNTAIVAATANATATATTTAIVAATANATATTIATTATTTIASFNCPLIIMIGNRGDQHYYSIGKWQALLITIENSQLKHIHLCIITS
jgi:hypothetical protein